jgi:hypothetical protein
VHGRAESKGSWEAQPLDLGKRPPGFCRNNLGGFYTT